MQKPYRSVLKRVVLWPLVIMLLLSAAVFVTAMLNYDQTRKQETENHLSIMRSGYIQLQNTMRQCEFTFARYFSTEPSSGILKNVKEGAQSIVYYEALVDSIRVLEPVKNAKIPARIVSAYASPSSRYALPSDLFSVPPGKFSFITKPPQIIIT